MNKTVTVQQIQELDRVAIEERGIPSLALMENAGQACVQEILKKAPARVTVVCGLGNNAGDGFVVARHLKEQGVSVDIFVVGDAKRFSPDARANYSKIRGKVTFIQEVTAPFVDSLQNADLVVDAVFGVGISRAIADPFRSVINAINKHAKYIFSVDIPSGLDGTTGEIHGVCVRADKTITFTFVKEGMTHSDRCGEIVVADIGIPEILKKKVLA